MLYDENENIENASNIINVQQSVSDYSHFNLIFLTSKYNFLNSNCGNILNLQSKIKFLWKGYFILFKYKILIIGTLIVAYNLVSKKKLIID
jgi:hypothetical protein